MKTQSILKHSFPITPVINGQRVWQFTLQTPRGDVTRNVEVQFSSNEWEQAAFARAALADIRASL